MTQVSRDTSCKLRAMRRLALLCFLAALSLTQIAAAEPAELSGSVVLPDGEPAVGATVRIVENVPGGVRAVVVTGDDGTFHAAELSGKNFSVRVEAIGMAPVTRIDVDAGATLEFSLEPGRQLNGVVTDKENGARVEGATIRLCDRQAGRFGYEACSRATSDKDGAFSFDELAAESSGVMAYSPRHAGAIPPSVEVPPKIDPDTEEPELLEIQLEPGGRISGTVIGPDDSPLVEADVTLLHVGRGRSARYPVPGNERSGDDGSFDFVGVPLGDRYYLSAETDGLARIIDGPYEIEQGDHVAGRKLRLDRGSTLKFRLVDEDDRPASVSSLHLQPEDGERWQNLLLAPEEIRTDGRGNHTVEHLPVGLYHLELEPQDLVPIHRDDVQLELGEPTDLGTLVARLGAAISGRVTDSQGLGVEADVTARFGYGKSRMTRSGKNGRYRLVGLDEGTARSVTVGQAQGFLSVELRDIDTGRDDVDFVLLRSAAVYGRVLTFTGEPTADYKVRAHDEAGGDGSRQSQRLGYPQLQRFDEGRFRLSELEPGRFTLEATSDDWAPARKTGVVVEEGQEIDVGVLQLSEGLVLEGRVVEGRESTPVTGARIKISPPGSLRFGSSSSGVRQTESGPDGRFVLRGLASGSFEVTAEHPVFAPVQRRVVLDEGSPTEEIEIRMRGGGTLTGTVTDAEQNPVAGVRIQAVVPAGGAAPPESGRTGSDGRYVIERLPEGSYMVMREGDDTGGLLPQGGGIKQATITDGGTTVVDFSERTRIRLSGRVLRGEEPISGATLLFVPRPEDNLTFLSGDMQAVAAGEDGSYSIGLDAPGTYQAMVQSHDAGNFGNERAVEIFVPDEESVTRDIVLSTNSITGTVTDADGDAVSGAVISASIAGAGPLDMTGRTMGRTDGAGRYSMSGLEAGTYAMSASAHGLAVAEKPSVVIADGSNTIDFVLERGRTLRGRVLDPAGRSVADAMVLVAPTGSNDNSIHGSTQTDLNGAFEINVPDEVAVDVSAISMAWAPGLLSGVDLTVLPGDYEAVVQLSQGGTVLVTLVGIDGTPATGVHVLAVPMNETTLDSLSFFLNPPRPSNAEGRVTLERLPQGSYTLQVPGRPDVQSVAVEVIDGDVHGITMQIP